MINLGTPQQISDATQAIVWKADYSPFGEATVTTETIVNNLRFPDQYYDSENNLHYNNFRYYDPQLGRYITSDPIGLNGGINTYVYAGQNPIMRYDSTGEGLLTILAFIGSAWVAYDVWVEWCDFHERKEEAEREVERAWREYFDGGNAEGLQDSQQSRIEAAGEGAEFGSHFPGTSTRPNIPSVPRR